MPPSPAGDSSRLGKTIGEPAELGVLRWPGELAADGKGDDATDEKRAIGTADGGADVFVDGVGAAPSRTPPA